MLAVHTAVVGRLDADLRARHGLSVTSYEVLMLLGDAPRGRLRVSELSAATLLSVSGMSRMVDRLVREGLVVKESCEEDGRGAEVVLTGTGADAPAGGPGQPPGRGAPGVPLALRPGRAARDGGVLGARRALRRGTGLTRGAPDSPSRRAMAALRP